MTEFLPGPIHTEEHARRRRLARRRARRRRRITLLLIVVLVVAGIVAAIVLTGGHKSAAKPHKTPKAAASAKAKATRSSQASASPTPTHSATPSGLPSPSATATHGAASPTPAAAPTLAAGAPHIVQDLVPYGDARKAEMAAYSQRHYGQDTWRLDPKAIVLHYTAGPTYSAAHATFAGNATNLGELPGVAAHFVIDTNGTIYQQVPLDVRCRHTIGLNYCAIGIEFVQPAGASPSWATDQILMRKAQLDAGLRLVAWLQAKYGISDSNVIGHAMANASTLFVDKEGWRNDHVDWEPAAVQRFRQDLAQVR